MALPWRRGPPQEVPAPFAKEPASDDLGASALPSNDVLAFIRAASGKSQVDILRAWDQCHGEDAEQKVDDCLAVLLQDDHEPGQREAGPSRAPQTAAGPAPPPADVIDVDQVAVAGPHQGPSEVGLTEDSAVAQITSIFPGIDTQFAAVMLSNAAWADKQLPDRLLETMEHIFGLNGDYPRAKPQEGKGKRKRSEAEEEEDALKAQEERYMKRPLAAMPPVGYGEACVEILLDDFPTIPKPHIVKTAKRHRHFYAPSFTALKRDLASIGKGGFQAFVPLRNSRKGKKQAIPMPQDLEQEQTWLHRREARLQALEDAKAAEKQQDACEEAAGMFIECSCCFGEVPFRKMVQCPEAHLFCEDCARQHCQTLLGDRRCDLKCMDSSGCQAEFSDAELARCLDANLLDLLARIRQEKEVALAGLDGLEKCVACDFAAIIEDVNEKLFHCQNEDCGKVFCRKCRESEHLPKTCEEAKAEREANSVHKVEEAMSAALIRNCPKCQQPFVKLDGCNKMRCTNCGTLSCFVCRQRITGYEHFRDGGGYSGGRVNAGASCPLHDDSEVRTHGEVEAARMAAAVEVQQANPNVRQEQLERLREPAPARRAVPQVARAFDMGNVQPMVQPEARGVGVFAGLADYRFEFNLDPLDWRNAAPGGDGRIPQNDLPRVAQRFPAHIARRHQHQPPQLPGNAARAFQAVQVQRR